MIQETKVEAIMPFFGVNLEVTHHHLFCILLVMQGQASLIMEWDCTRAWMLKGAHHWGPP